MKSVKEALKRFHPWSASQIRKVVNILPQKVVLITINYCLRYPKKLHLFILLYQMRRNYELRAIAILEQFINEQYAKKLYNSNK